MFLVINPIENIAQTPALISSPVDCARSAQAQLRESSQEGLEGRSGDLSDCWEGIWELPTPTVCILYSLGVSSSLPTFPALKISLKSQRGFVFSPWICFHGKCGSADPTPSNDTEHKDYRGNTPLFIPHHSHLTPITWKVWNTKFGKFGRKVLHSHQRNRILHGEKFIPPRRSFSTFPVLER